MKVIAGASLVLLSLVLPARAGVYSPDEPFNFDIGSDGFAKPIQFAGGFESIVAGVREPAVQPRSPSDPPNLVRREADARVASRKAKGVPNLSADELAGLGADLLRLGKPGEVLNLLQPLARDPRGGFLVHTHLAQAFAATGDWRTAFEHQQMAVRYSDFPTAFGKLTMSQLSWLKRVEREYYLPLLAHRAEEARRGRVAGLREDVDALFPPAVPPKRADNPLRFEGEGVPYTAGSLAAAERAKLPPDALAVVQQLVLWNPHDARLYWLLGELLNADGDVEAAAKVLDHCSYNMGYSNPTLVRHRQVLNEAVAASSARKAAEAEQVRQAEAAEKERLDDELRQREDAERDYQKRFWWILAIGVALGVLLVYYQVREVVRRVRRAGKEA